MANLGAEVSRLVSFKEKGNRILAGKALNRAERILAEIKTFPEMKSRLEEIVLLETQVANVANTEAESTASASRLKSYFQPFALRMLKDGDMAAVDADNGIVHKI